MTRLLPPMPLGMILSVGFAIFAPGYFLTRILRLNFEDSLTKVIFYLTLGFIYVWLLGFVAILMGLTLNIFALIWVLLLVLMFIYSLFLDKNKKNNKLEPIKFKDWLNLNNLLYIFVFVTAFLIIMYLVRIGALFKGGDANYHLSTIRKVISGEALTIHNLSYAKDKMLIVYGFPVWHIFMGLMVKIANSDIFIVWRDMPAALLSLAMPVWYWFSRKVLPSKNMAILAFIIFSFFGFYWGPAYVYSTLGIPHTFTQLLLLPLAAGLSLCFVFEKPSKRILAIILVLILTGSAVHITFYFYLLTVLVAMLICYALFCWKDPSYSKVLKRLGALILCQLLIIVPLAIGLELKGQAVSKYYQAFQDPNYPTEIKYKGVNDFNGYSLYAYIFLTSVLLFVKKYPKLILAFSTLLVIPVIYFTPLKLVLIKSIGLVYINRLYGTLDWSFLVWALIIGVILALAETLVLKLAKTKKINAIVTSILALIVFYLFYQQEQIRWSKDLWKTIFDGKFLDFTAETYLWPLVIFAIIFLGFYIWQHFKNCKNDLNLEEVKLPLINFLLASVFILIIAAPDWMVFKTYLFDKNGPEYFWRSMASIAEIKAESYSDPLGGEEVINFIKENIPPKSVFDTNSGYFYLPIMLDQHMPVYHSLAASEDLELYDDKTTLPARLEIVHRRKIDYLLVRPSKEGIIVMEQYPKYFEKIYEGQYNVYRINKEAINHDYPSYCRPDEEKINRKGELR